ncbi:MAG: hypothetical protein IPP43_14965 [Chitinophagaceae bacterium]|nr:hypothetical protein [Chitinophagaceae bacterium]
MKVAILLTVFTLYTLISTAQPRIISGPMLGPVELKDAKIWVEVSPEVKLFPCRLIKRRCKNYKDG